jgi:crossover junction endodeoxyribonuclease RuvC
MGIDPGFAITGYGIVKYIGNRFSMIDYGVIQTKAGIIFSQRLVTLYLKLEELIKKYSPQAIVVEELFFNKNIKTAITASHGRGVALLAAASSGADVYEYTPLQIKQAVAGYGRASKSQVQQMVKMLLNLPGIPRPDDAADALAAAICHAHSFRMNNVINKK